MKKIRPSWLPRLSLLIVAAIGFSGAAYWLASEFLGVPGHLHRHYPITTGFYLELSPGDALMRRAVSLLATENPAFGNKSPGKTAQTLPTRFVETFKSRFSIGAWPDASGQKPTNGERPALIVLPLRQSISLQELVRRFGRQPEDFLSGRYRGLDYLEAGQNGAAMVIMEQKLLIANSVSALRFSIDHYLQHRPDVFQSPEVQACLGRLPWFRQGAFILNNQVDDVVKRATKTPMGNVAKVFPMMAGSIQAKWDHLISIRLVMPVALANIPDQALRTEFRRILETRESFPQVKHLPADTAAMVALAGPDRDFDFYRRFLMPPEQLRWLRMGEMLLSGFSLDIRKDLIGLLHDRVVVAVRVGRQPSLITVVDKSESKDATLDKVSRLISTNAFPLRLESIETSPSKDEAGTADEPAVRTLRLPALDDKTPARLSFGTVGDWLVFATPEDYQTMRDVARGKQENVMQTSRYRTAWQDMPSKSNVLGYLNVTAQARFMPPAPGMESPATWLDAVGFALWGEPDQGAHGDRMMLNGQINLRLANHKG